MKLKPLHDRVVIKPAKAEEITKSGIVIPDTADKEKPQEGEVIAVGEGKRSEGKFVPMQVKVGDKVLYAKYGGDEIKIKNEEYLVVKEEDILAIIK